METKTIWITKALIAIAIFCLSFNSYAQNGSLDLTFDTDGKVTTDIDSLQNYARSVAIQNDGKIVIAGESSSNIDFTIIRYNTNGSLDTSFDTDGIVTTSIGYSIEKARSVVIQSDGKIVVAGYCYNGLRNVFVVLRYNANGSLDTSFGTNGVVTTNIGNAHAWGMSVAIDGSGKIVVAGYTCIPFTPVDIAVMRYNTDGSLDTSFDTDGIVTTPIGTADDMGYSVAVQSDGKIVVSGYSGNGSNQDIAVVRYNSNGSLDTSFDTDGIVTTAIGTADERAFSMTIQNDGKIVVSGQSSVGSDFDIAVVRYNTNGSLDTSFNTDGIVTTSVGIADDIGYSVAVQSDGKIVVSGQSDNGSDYDIAVVRYDANGNLDTSFDTDGKLTTSIGNPSYEGGLSMAIQNDGKIVIAGYAAVSISTDFAVVRYNNTITGGVNTIDNQNKGITIYPNPFVETTTLHTDVALINATFAVYNPLGEQVKEIKNISGRYFTFNRENLSAGFYFIKLTEENKVVAASKIIITD